MNRWRYLFTHILLRDTAYTMQLRARRRQLHRLAAEALRALYGDEPAAHAADLAYHYDRAGMPYQATAWYRYAGERAAAQYATEEAVNHFSRALELIAGDDLRGRYETLLAREEVYDWRGERAAQRADLAALAALAARLGVEEETAVLLRRANYASATGDYAAAARLAEAAIGYAKARRDSARQAQAQHRLGSALWRQNRHEQALPHFEAALALARAGDEPRLVTQCLNGLGMVLDEQSDYETARRHYEEALRIQRRHGDLLGQNKTLNNLGWIFFMQGDTVTAQRYYEEALRAARQTGNRIAESSAMTNVGVIAFKHGDTETAQAYYEACLALCEEIGNVGGEANMHANLALLYHRRGEEETAVAHARRAVNMAQAISYHPTQAEASVYLGHARLAQGDLDAAAAAYHRAVQLNQEGKRLSRVMEGRAGLARVALARGDLATAAAEVEAILRQMGEGGSDGVLELSLVYLTCYRVLAALADSRAAAVLEAGYRELRTRAERIQDAGTRRRFLEEIPAHRQLAALWTAERRGQKVF
jgi:tetratricopeptide (TPR) repeat protein